MLQARHWLIGAPVSYYTAKVRAYLQYKKLPFFEVQATRAEDDGREIELLTPVVDDRAAEKPLRPGVHLGGNLLGGGDEHLILRDRQLQVALIVERHRRHLAERVFAVEHPAVGAGQQRIGHVPDAAVESRVWL